MRSALRALGLAALAAGLPAARAPALAWSVYEDARLDTRAYADGDSFHVKTPRKTYVLRLYFVDAPETDDSIPARVREQADYWGTDPEQVLRLGEEARRFTRAFLARPFTAYTRREDARGRPGSKRYYAMVRAEGGYLSEALVSNGLARVYGRGTEQPDGSTERAYWRRLERLERAARRAGRGAWARAAPDERPAADAVAEAERDITLPRTVLVYGAGGGAPRPIGRLRRGAVVRVLGEAVPPGMVRVRFDAAGVPREGRCRRTELGL